MNLGPRREKVDAYDGLKSTWVKKWPSESTWSRGDEGSLLILVHEVDLDRVQRIAKLVKVKVKPETGTGAGKILCHLSGPHSAVTDVVAWIMNGSGTKR
jgi:hypothetical protein